MLYLIVDHSIDIRTNKHVRLVKVGYTNNISKRMQAYKTANPTAYLVATKPGDTIDETHCHDYMLNRLNCIKVYGEWFLVDEKMFNDFISNGFQMFRKNSKNTFVNKYIKET